jgi:hypothetical protein
MPSQCLIINLIISLHCLSWTTQCSRGPTWLNGHYGHQHLLCSYMPSHHIDSYSDSLPLTLRHWTIYRLHTTHMWAIGSACQVWFQFDLGWTSSMLDLVRDIETTCTCESETLMHSYQICWAGMRCKQNMCFRVPFLKKNGGQIFQF